jgi:hypothetical protein
MFLRSIMESCLIFFISTIAIGLYVLLPSVTNLSHLIILLRAIMARISGLVAYKWLLSRTLEGQDPGEAYYVRSCRCGLMAKCSTCHEAYNQLRYRNSNRFSSMRGCHNGELTFFLSLTARSRLTWRPQMPVRLCDKS